MTTTNRPIGKSKAAICYCGHCKANRAFVFDGFDTYGAERHRCEACGNVYSQAAADAHATGFSVGDRVRHSGRVIQRARDYWLSCGREPMKSGAKRDLDEKTRARGVVEEIRRNSCGSFSLFVRWHDGHTSDCLAYMVDKIQPTPQVAALPGMTPLGLKQDCLNGAITSRELLRQIQDRVVAICERRGFNMDAPISDLQHGAPSANELRSALYPEFAASLESFLKQFESL